MLQLSLDSGESNVWGPGQAGGSLGWPSLFPTLPWGGISLTLGGHWAPCAPFTGRDEMDPVHQHHHLGKQIVVFSLVPDREWGTKRCCNVPKITQLHSSRVGSDPEKSLQSPHPGPQHGDTGVASHAQECSQGPRQESPPVPLLMDIRAHQEM